MRSPLCRYPAGTCALLPPQLFGSVAYYALMAQYPQAVIDTTLRYDKRFKSVHRYSIAGTDGELRLTVPVSRPEGAFLEGNLSWDRVTVSDHGRWWEVHMQALESAYSRTPYFEFYIDRFAHLFRPEHRPITDLVTEADSIIRDILGIAPPPDTPSADVHDYRHVDFSTIATSHSYWQIWADKNGFLPSLSVLDLIFNLGTEAPLLLINDEKLNFAL